MRSIVRSASSVLHLEFLRFGTRKDPRREDRTTKEKDKEKTIPSYLQLKSSEVTPEKGNAKAKRVRKLKTLEKLQNEVLRELELWRGRMLSKEDLGGLFISEMISSPGRGSIETRN